MAVVSESPAEAHPDHEAHPPHLYHHFVSSEQQFDASKMGMWMFLVTEILLFGGMFVAYIVYRSWNPEVFVEASNYLDTALGALNTVVLLTSSLTVALSIHYIQHDNRKAAAFNLFLTILCACIFMVVKYFEYTHKFHEGIFPGEAYAFGELDLWRVPIFFSIYFVMTGIHGVHVLVGIGLITWVMIMVMRGRFNSQYYTHVELVGLYWHLVDIIWIFLFPLLYLI